MYPLVLLGGTILRPIFVFVTIHRLIVVADQGVEGRLVMADQGQHAILGGRTTLGLGQNFLLVVTTRRGGSYHSPRQQLLVSLMLELSLMTDLDVADANTVQVRIFFTAFERLW